MPSPASIAADVVTAAGIHVIDVTHPEPGAVRLIVTPGSERAAELALLRAGHAARITWPSGAVLVVAPEPDATALAEREAAADAAEQAARDQAAAADVRAAVLSELNIALAHGDAHTVGDFAADVAAALMRRYNVGQDDTADEPADAGPLWCAECGTHTAASYVVTILGRDQDDPTARTEVCLPCHEDLVHGPSEDETVDRHTGETLPRGRCDTCGAPVDDDGCTRDAGHAVALDVDVIVWIDCPACTYRAHDHADLVEHGRLNHD